MREHPAIGERILRAIPGLGGVARIVRHEHERFDGAGYPDGLAGEQIPIGSRIILACDAYHAMTSDRPYRAAMPHDEAVAELVSCSGTQFDPRVVAALIGHVGGLDGPRFTSRR
jgi:HD-GYP domain-containing protein (c-di-GMP phosphodiesterase class II)